MRFRTFCPVLVLCLVLSGHAFGGTRPDTAPPGAEPTDPELDGMLLPWSFFTALAEEDEAMVIDVRADFLGGPTPPGMETARPIPLAIFRDNFVARKANQDKMLLIFDESGQTYSALHRHLRDHGYLEYFFLAGGVENTMRLLRGGS